MLTMRLKSGMLLEVHDRANGGITLVGSAEYSLADGKRVVPVVYDLNPMERKALKAAL